MKFVKSNYKKKCLILLLLSFGMIMTNLSLSLFNSSFLNNNYEEGNIIDYDDQIILPKASDSLPFFNGAGAKVNVSLHQSILNKSTLPFSNLDISNSFTEPFPNFNGYNTSFINITIENLYAPDKFLNIEDVYSGRQSVTTITYTSFEVNSNAKLDNLSIQVRNNGGAERYDINVYNSTWDGSDLTPDTDLNGVLSDVVQIVQADTGLSNIWINATNLDFDLDISNTDNNTFFISVKNSASIGEWIYENEGNGDDTIVYVGSVFWDQDQNLKMDLKPIDNTPKPSDINLKVNGIAVSDHSSGSNLGNWVPQQEFSSITDNIDFTITSGWWAVSCNITKVQINYTKTDLSADSSFEVLGNGQDIFWNVTKSGGLNYFDSRFNNYTINFTISSRWTNIEVWNGSNDKTSDIIPHDLNNYKNIQVFNAGNGTFWFLNATSSNLLENIKKYIGAMPATDTFNYTDLVHFNGNFSSSINNGTITLSVYNPSALNDQLNYTLVNNSFGSGTDLYFGDWDISDNVTKYGMFRILTQWNNGTDAGFFRDNITILAETSLVINQPIQNSIFNSSKIFNITITYSDTGQALDISDGDIYYKINAETYSSVNDSVEYIDNGQYNITFDCNNTAFNYGSNTIAIRANNSYYHNQTETLDFFILGETSLNRSIPKMSFDSGEIFNVTLYFNDTVKNIGINEPTVEIFINSSVYTPLDFYDYKKWVL